MYKNKLCLALSQSFGVGLTEQIAMIKKAGFEGFFFDWSADIDVSVIKKCAEENGLELQSVHGPYYNSAVMWESEENAAEAVKEMLHCLDDCKLCNAPIMVLHTFIGFNDTTHSVCENGFINYGKVVDRAEELGIKIAFENTEGEEYLDALMTHFADRPHVGFCLDTGHEMCYNFSKDLLEKYGDRLIATHINDNLGISRQDGSTFWTDDLHLLPFDGCADWEFFAKRLNRHGYNGFLTFELTRKSKPDRHENDKYMKMTLEEYLAEAYSRACRVATLKERYK